MRMKTPFAVLALAVPLALAGPARAETELEVEATCGPPTCATKIKVEAEWESNTSGTSIKFKAKVVVAPSATPPTLEVNGDSLVTCTLALDPAKSTATRSVYRVSGRLRKGVTTFQTGSCDAIPTGITDASTVTVPSTGLVGTFGSESDD